MRLENIYIKGEQKGFEISLNGLFPNGIYISSIKDICINIDGQLIDNNNILFKMAQHEVPLINLDILKFEFLDRKETIKIFARNICLSQGCHDVKIEYTYFEYSFFSPNRYRELNVGQTFTRIVENRFISCNNSFTDWRLCV